MRAVIEASPTPALTSERTERAVAGSSPEIILDRSRRFCASCQKRKTRYLVKYSRYCKHRRCWACLTDEERRTFREGY